MIVLNTKIVKLFRKVKFVYLFINFCQQKLCFVSILLDASETRDPKTKQNKQTNEKKERKKE